MELYEKSSQQVIKESNIKLVFGLIHSQGPISRADIKKKTGLSATTVSSLVEELLAENLVKEGGIKDTTTSGRKATLLHIDAEGGYFMGVDIRNDCITADTYSLDFSSVFHIDIPFTQNENLELCLLRALSIASRERKILGITIGLPGVVDSITNEVLSSTVIDAKTAKNVYKIVSEAMPDVKINLRNNSGLVAYAEKEFGIRKKVSNLISIDIDDGVGAGIIIDGSIYNGSSGKAGEFGHISIDYNGEKCKCGSYGCLELIASVPAILKKSNSCSLSDLYEKLCSNDSLSIETIDNVARALAFGINTIKNIVDPESIVICGSIRALGNYLLEPLNKYIKNIALIDNKLIEYSTLQTNAVTLGGARISFEEMFGV